MSWAADGQDGKELELEKKKFKALCLGKLAQTLILVYYFFENSLDFLLLVFDKHFVSNKGT